MIKITRILMAATTLAIAASGAHAADLSQPHILNYPAPAPDPVATTGWYLRGDVGVGIVSQGNIWESSINNPTAGTTSGWLNKSIGDTTTIGAGVGYQFSDNLRGDVTLQYRTAVPFQAGNYVTNTASGLTGENAISGRVSSTVAMVNGYYDVTHWNGLTPFVGAGVGVAFNQMGATSTQQGGFTTPEYGVYPTKNFTNLAWALHAGLSYDINTRLKLEMGYSYLNLGDTKSGGLTCYGAGTPSNCNDILKVRNLSSNDFHIGMRWLLDAPTPVAWQPSAPVVAKY